jgi:Peptidase family S41
VTVPSNRGFREGPTRGRWTTRAVTKRAGGLLLCAAVGLTCAPVRAAETENLQLSTAQWRDDLAFLARELPKRHANAFHFTTRERFEAAVADLDRRLLRLDPPHIYVEMLRIVNSIGDGHTYLRFPVDSEDFPLSVGQFDDQYRVICAAPRFAKAVGSRLIAINDTPIDRVHKLILFVTPQDETIVYREALVAHWMTIGILLHGLDIAPGSGSARFHLVDDQGVKFSIDVRPDATQERQWAFAKPPLFRQQPDETFWYEWLPQARTVYCNWRTYKNLREKSQGLFDLIEKKRPDKLVVDLRQNGGGDYFVGLACMVNRIRDLKEINRSGHLFVLIGPFTFSAAMSNAAHFRQKTAATLVGQPIGEKPNSYQEARRLTLPNSHLTLSYSVRFYKFVESGENAICPDRAVTTRWSDFKAGRDPVLQSVLEPPPFD